MVRAAPGSCHLHLFPARLGSRGAVARAHRTHACDASALSPPHVSRPSQSRACVRARARAPGPAMACAGTEKSTSGVAQAASRRARRRSAGHPQQSSSCQRFGRAALRSTEETGPGTPSREMRGGTRAHIHGAAPWRLFSSIRAICSGVKGGAAAASARGHPGCCRAARAAGARAPGGPVIAPSPEATAPCGCSEKW
jgi:hypothetical protein